MHAGHVEMLEAINEAIDEQAPTPAAPCGNEELVSEIYRATRAHREQNDADIDPYDLLDRAASALAETKAEGPKDGAWWLIETFPPDIGRVGGRYYCGPGQWCDNPNHAHQFATQAMAIEAMNTMASRAELRVTEHEWS